jgi:hypothetical protein
MFDNRLRDHLTREKDRMLGRKVVNEVAEAKLDNLIIGMIEAGYECRAREPEVAELDRQIVEGGRCRQCKGELHYEPFWKQGSYRPFAICMRCGDTREF